MLKSTKTAQEASGMIGKLLAWIPLDPNSITLTSIFVAFFGFIAYEPNLVGGIMSLLLFLIAFALDVVDGAIARAKNMVTKEGAFIDGIADRIVEFLLLLVLLKMFATNSTVQVVIVSILFFGTCMTAFVKAYSEHKGMLKHEKAEKLGGVLERSERSLLLLIAFTLVVAGQTQYGIYALYLTAILSFFTFLQRFLAVLYGEKD